MIAFPEMLVNPAKKAGIEIPNDVENFEKYKKSHPHFFVFCLMQLGQPMPYASAHWDNALIISKILKEDIFKITIEEIVNLGFQIGYSSL